MFWTQLCHSMFSLRVTSSVFMYSTGPWNEFVLNLQDTLSHYYLYRVYLDDISFNISSDSPAELPLIFISSMLNFRHDCTLCRYICHLSRSTRCNVIIKASTVVGCNDLFFIRHDVACVSKLRQLSAAAICSSFKSIIIFMKINFPLSN